MTVDLMTITCNLYRRASCTATIVGLFLSATSGVSMAQTPATPEAVDTPAAPAAPPSPLSIMPLFPPDEETGIPNYFLHIVNLLEKTRDKPIPEPRPGSRGLIEPRDYPFDDFEAFRSRDMMRAIKEGIRQAEDTGYGKSPAEIDRQAEANIRLILQYYPVAAADRDGFMNLWYVMESPQSNETFRRILFTSALPSHYNESLFTQYLQDKIRDETPKMLDLYAKVLLNEMDRNNIRLLALENMYALRVQECETLLARDPNAAAFMAANNRPPGPKDLIDPPAFTPARASKIAVSNLRGDLDSMAALLGTMLAPSAPTKPSLRRALRNVLLRMKTELPLVAPEKVDEYLAAAPAPSPDAVDTPDAPASPAAPPQDAAAPPEEEALSF